MLTNVPLFKDLLEGFDPERPAVAIDFETFYDLKDGYSVQKSGYWAYTHDPRFEAYLVSIHGVTAGGAPVHFVGEPEDAPWGLLEGALWLAHNRPFDEHVYHRLVELGTVPLIQAHAWCDTADMCRYLKWPASLGKATPAMLGYDLDKGARDSMDGVRWKDLDPDQARRILDYADGDAVACYDLWDRYRKDWPRKEMLLSMHTAELVKRGVYVDRERVEQAIDILPQAIERIEASIPWAGEPMLTPTGKTRMRGGEPQLKSPTSSVWLSRYCESLGVPVPESTDVKDEAWHNWRSQFETSKAFPVIQAMQHWRKVNRTLRIAEQIRDRIRDDGRLEFSLMYYGARNTGRWSGKKSEYVDDDKSTNLNMLNLPRDHLYLNNRYEIAQGMDDVAFNFYIREWFMAPPGKILIVSDLSQIEPRVLHFVVGDDDFIDLVRDGMDVYEAYARKAMGYTDPRPLKDVNGDLRQMCKVHELLMGYQGGPGKVGHSAYVMLGIEMTEEESVVAVKDYRAKNPKIVKFWYARHDDLVRCAAMRRVNRHRPLTEPDYTITLGNGRTLQYFGLQKQGREIVGSTYRGGKRAKLYGGKCVENAVQAYARDVFVEGILRLEAAGIPVLWHIYDEVVAECDHDMDPAIVADLMSISPDWAPDLPVAAEAEAMERYRK